MTVPTPAAGPRVVPTGIPLTNITRDKRAWPRKQLDDERVEDFLAHYTTGGPNALPPVEVVNGNNGKFELSDGHHRLAALEQSGVETTLAVVLSVPTGRSTVDYAYERALMHSAVTAKPLTRAEKRTAVRRLLVERPLASDREIGRLVGVDNKTVGAMRTSVRNSSPEWNGSRAVVTASPATIAARAVRNLLDLCKASSWDFEQAGANLFMALERLPGDTRDALLTLGELIAAAATRTSEVAEE